MKTKILEVLKADTLDEIIFENRNKEYGSYELRKKKDESLLVALLMSLSFLILFALSAKLFSLVKPTIVVPDDTEISTSFINLSPEKIVLPKLPVIEIPKSLISDIIFRKPVIVNNPVDDIQNTLPSVSNFLDKPDAENNNLNGNTLIPTTTTTNEIPKDNEIPFNVEEMPVFRGGFPNWLNNNLYYSIDAIESRLQGTVVVEFVVNEKGKVTNAKIVKGLHPVLDEAVLKTVSKSPDWKPGKQNGYPVKVRFMVPVKFRIEING